MLKCHNTDDRFDTYFSLVKNEKKKTKTKINID